MYGEVVVILEPKLLILKLESTNFDFLCLKSFLEILLYLPKFNVITMQYIEYSIRNI